MASFTRSGEGQRHIYENKAKSLTENLDCTSIDAQTHSFDFALGAATHMIAFTNTGCNDRVSVIFDIPGHTIHDNGDCIDADAYLHV